MNVTLPVPSLATNHALNVGDIVSFRFPYPSREACLTRIPRPCVIIDKADYLGGIFLEMLPGTQSLLPEHAPSDLVIDPAALFPEHQHLRAWRFIAAYHDRFDVAHPGFAATGACGPLRLGRAYGSTLDAIDHLRGQLQATREKHIAKRRALRAARRKL